MLLPVVAGYTPNLGLSVYFEPLFLRFEVADRAPGLAAASVTKVSELVVPEAGGWPLYAA